MSWDRQFSLNQLKAAFDEIARRAQLPPEPTQQPRCDCPCPCFLAVLEPGGICAMCATDPGCARRIYQAAQRRAVG